MILTSFRPHIWCLPQMFLISNDWLWILAVHTSCLCHFETLHSLLTAQTAMVLLFASTGTSYSPLFSFFVSNPSLIFSLIVLITIKSFPFATAPLPILPFLSFMFFTMPFGQLFLFDATYFPFLSGVITSFSSYVFTSSFFWLSTMMQQNYLNSPPLKIWPLTHVDAVPLFSFWDVRQVMWF